MFGWSLRVPCGRGVLSLYIKEIFRGGGTFLGSGSVCGEGSVAVLRAVRHVGALAARGLCLELVFVA